MLLLSSQIYLPWFTWNLLIPLIHDWLTKLLTAIGNWQVNLCYCNFSFGIESKLETLDALDDLKDFKTFISMILLTVVAQDGGGLFSTTTESHNACPERTKIHVFLDLRTLRTCSFTSFFVFNRM